jgi:hypothetical protein
MNNLIHIDEPCNQDINRMTLCGKNFYCNSCSKEVIDLRNFTKCAAGQFVQENKGICAVVHKRHTETTVRYAFINRIEQYVLAWRFKKMAVGVVFLLMVITGCHSKRKTHKMGMVRALKNTTSTEQLHSEK